MEAAGREEGTTPAAAVIVAAGDGRRMGLAAGVAKVFALVAGKPVVARALGPFLRHPRVTQVVLVLRPCDRELLGTDRIAGWNPPSGVLLAEGGRTRRESVLAGLRALGLARGSATPDEEDARPVLVHDGARPFVDPRDLDALLAALEGADGAVPGAPLSSSLKRVDPDLWIAESPDRARHRLALTPQAFRMRTLREALEQAGRAGREVSDCAEAVAAAGGRVRMIEARSPDLKITFPADLDLAEALLARTRREY
ncbi:MAG: 2-C-methyl-D-erythritol 4-phosphate cytidylyltransferase [Planctomycetes bacterium]|nr:2-C-methyl-D-erythritol 4-phosphate cytidylyltransferase [Planctomycetota bacterium]